MKKSLKYVLAAVLMLFVFNAAAQQGNVNMSQYRLGVGDKILIKVFGQSDLSMETRIPDVGKINYPFLGELKLVGLTLSQVESLVYDGLEGDYLVNPSIAVSIVEYRPFFIDGEVKDPGGYPYQPGLSVNKAAALAGGYTERASRSDIQIIRQMGKEQRAIEVDVGHLIQPGDIITVPQRFF
ncbi:polysaccharide biosynthesis/export family protein [Salinimonas chungwhensis]|uniref:polysaccharide biosynthesis/export family protein n=1 Tax=Salinimonas chungwhensis TaxID=265425 RepID=UPI0003797448|nr:polysaccharide biosynthesis/export family protein [Salinimonas chungwhensis]